MFVPVCDSRLATCLPSRRQADEVQRFCNECVLSEEEEPCEVPEKFIENAGLNPWEIAP